MMGNRINRPRSALFPGITATSAGFIDASFILLMVLLFAVAALKVAAPQKMTMDLATATSGQNSSEPPLVSLNVFSDGVVIDGGELHVPFLELADYVVALENRDGVIAVCVGDTVSYHVVRDVIATLQNALGPRSWVDCGGAP